MSEHLILQEIEEGIWKVVDSDNDYDVLYRRINDDKNQEGNKKLMIVERRYLFRPAKKINKKRH